MGHYTKYRVVSLKDLPAQMVLIDKEVAVNRPLVSEGE